MFIARLNNCCCCIPLKAGVLIITLLWLCYGIYSCAILIRTVIQIVLYALTTLGAAFGLYVLTCANTYKNLRIYSGIVILSTLHDILSNFIVTIIEVSDSSCLFYKCDFLPVSIAISIFASLLSIYFAIVVYTYAQRRKSKEDAAAAAAPYRQPVVYHPYVVGMTNVVPATASNHPYSVVMTNVAPVTANNYPYGQTTITNVSTAADSSSYRQTNPITVDDHPYGQTSDDLMTSVPVTVDDHPYGQTSDDLVTRIQATADDHPYGQTSDDLNMATQADSSDSNFGTARVS
ncbi:uncharacterized protein OCT59_027341 [Rhizophagus irregularis]|uniref:uncharacterized protein n=1 Tax=Rhizophagus irregularis TaxID=588596 RepID=UPI00332EF086|nr:hypothetical protein OCT59_027341 [Rhizophagus irregularis]